MANPEHLAILKRGVEAWNRWREQNGHIEADLSGVNLSDVNLREADLSRANLSRADLIKADLSRANLIKADLNDACLANANLTEADLREASLWEANLSGACLFRVNLMDARLDMADLSKADLTEANLIGFVFRGMSPIQKRVMGTDLSEANLTNVRLNGVYFIDVKLSGAKLSGSDLSDAILSKANLSKANLSGANLRKADLSEADLSDANLDDVDAQFSQLCRCNLVRATLTGAKLYATARDDWIINDVECRYVFWDADGKIRSPKDRDLAPGEFERLYRTMPTIEYIFQNGMTPLDPLIMDRVVQAIREQNPEYDIKIDSISARGLAPSVKFTVLLEQYKEAALAQVRDLYEVKLRQVEAERDRYWAAIARALDAPREVKLIAAAPGSIVATDGSTINIDQHVEYITNLRDAVAAQPENSPTFIKVAKKTALDIIGSALKDVAKGQVKEAAKQIYELGKDLGPVIVKTAAYGFFKNCLGF